MVKVYEVRSRRVELFGALCSGGSTVTWWVTALVLVVHSGYVVSRHNVIRMW